jgi:hypothetical protein
MSPVPRPADRPASVARTLQRCPGKKAIREAGFGMINGLYLMSGMIYIKMIHQHLNILGDDKLVPHK